ncbi:MAG: BamA/TamA family outer membrane protein [bacterium]
MLKKLLLIIASILVIQLSIQANERKLLNLNTLIENVQITSKERPTKNVTSQKWETIDEIIISGNLSTNKTKIKNALLIRQNDLINPIKITRSIKNLRSNGEFKDVSYHIKKTEKGNTLIITIEENPVVTNVQFIGNTVYSKEKLHRLCPIQINKIKNQKDIRTAIQNIVNEYKKDGYIKAKIYNIKTPTDKKGPVIFYLSEGIIESVTISGNTRTRDYVILRELNLTPGTPLKSDILEKNLSQIYNLNYFEEILPDIQPGKKQNEYKLLIKLKEKESQGSISAGAGYGEDSGFNLFSDLFWENILGTGQQVMLKGTLAFGKGSSNSGYNSFQFKYHNPWAWNKRKSFTFRTWLKRGDLNLGPFGNNSQISYRNETRKGYDITIGWPQKYDFYSNHRIKYENIYVTDLAKQYELFSYTYILNLNRRNQNINTTKGYYHTLSIEKSLPLNPALIQYTKTEATFRNFYPVFKKQVIATKLNFGIINSPDIRNEEIYGSEWYYIGGSNTVRGYDELSPFAKGNKKVIANMEYRIIFTPKFQFILFVDIGYATLDNIYEYNRYKIGKGAGIRLNIPPLGPIRLDLGFDENNKSHFHFNVGHTF